MGLSLADALDRLTSDPGVVCKYRIGSATFGDEAEWDGLGQQFSDAVGTLTKAFGPPNVSCVFPGMEVEQSACWLDSGKVLYVLLTLEDNTRIRWLMLGICRRGEVQILS